jgi:hypothetical protein
MKKEKVKLNKGHYPEISDRIHVQMEMINTHLVQHPVAEENEKLKRLLIKAMLTLYAAYQETGIVMDNKSKTKTNARKHKLRS